MKRTGRGARGALLVLALLGVDIPETEGTLLLRQRDARTCFALSLGLLGEGVMVLQVTSVRADVRHLIGVLTLVDLPGSPTMPVTGVARERASDADVEIDVTFGAGSGVFFLSGKLIPPDLDSGVGTLWDPHQPLNELNVPLSAASCPTEFGDLL